MKLDDLKKLTARLPYSASQEGADRFRQLLLELGLDPDCLYQELEMSHRFFQLHRDTSWGGSPMQLHSHSFYELLSCRSSCGAEYLVGTQRFRLQRGDIIFVPPGVSHRPILPEHLTAPYERDVLWISKDFMENLLRMFPDDTIDQRNYKVPIRTAGTRWEFMGELFRRGVLEEEEKRPGWDAAVMGNTLTIFANLRRIYIERSAGTMKVEKPELTDRITAHIEKYYATHITIDNLARQFYVSNSTISHLFKQKMGVSVYRYITQRRLIAAKTLIGQKLPMEEIAQQVGFLDYSTFYRAFKQEYGISPRQFAQL